MERQPFHSRHEWVDNRIDCDHRRVWSRADRAACEDRMLPNSKRFEFQGVGNFLRHEPIQFLKRPLIGDVSF